MRAADHPRGRPRPEPARVDRGLGARWDVLAVVSAGGVLGSLARWGIATLLPRRPGGFPWATFGVNVAGCALLGALMVLVVDVWPPTRYARPFLGTGVLGGFTTFSTYLLDTRSLLAGDRPLTAGVYLVGSLAVGLLGVVGGAAGVRLVLPHAAGPGPQERERA
jgi:CrcB protein